MRTAPTLTGASSPNSDVGRPSSSPTYPDHPRATTAAPSANSRNRSQPMIQATQLSGGREGVRVGAAGSRHGGGQLGVAERGEHGEDPGDDERDDDGRSRRVAGLHAGQREDAGADHDADAEADQVPCREVFRRAPTPAASSSASPMSSTGLVRNRWRATASAPTRCGAAPQPARSKAASRFDPARVDLRFSGELWHWRGPSPFHFVTVPDGESGAIEDVAGQVSYGWGWCR